MRRIPGLRQLQLRCRAEECVRQTLTTLYDHMMRAMSEEWVHRHRHPQTSAGRKEAADEVEAKPLLLMAVRDQTGTGRYALTANKTSLLSPYFAEGKKSSKKYLKPHKSVNTGYNMPIA